LIVLPKLQNTLYGRIMHGDKRIRAGVKRPQGGFGGICIYSGSRKIGKSVLWIMIFVLIFLLTADFAYGRRHRRGLVVYSYRSTSRWARKFAEGIESALERYPYRVGLDVEYLDTFLYNDREHYENLYRLLKHKLESVDRGYEFIIVYRDEAFEFLLKHRAELYPDIPVIFCSLNMIDSPLPEDHKSIIMINKKSSVNATVDTALKLHPSAGRIIVIGTRTSSWAQQEIMNAIENSKRQVDVIYLKSQNMTVEELLEKIEVSAEEAIVISVTSVIVDRSRRIYPAEQSIEMIQQRCSSAIYATTDHWLGGGAIGGNMFDSYMQGQKAAEIAMQILDGQSIESIPPFHLVENNFMFDYRQLKRFGISLSDLPADSIIINEPKSFYYRHKKLIWSLAGVFTALVIVILVSAINIAKRLRAEAELKKSRQFLDSIINSIDDPIFVKDQQHRWVVLNEAACQVMGHHKEEIIGKSDYDLFPKEQADVFWEKDNLVLKTGETNVNEEKITWHGKLHVVSTKKSVFTYSLTGEKFITGVVRDVTEYRRTENELLFKTALLESQTETSIDGILVVDSDGKSILFNKRYGQIWNIPQQLLDTKDDEKMLRFVLDQVKEPQQFLERVKYLYAHANEESRDEIRLKDGRVLDRYSSPLSSSNGRYYGRIWYFRDVTDSKLSEEALQKSRDELELRVRHRTAQLERINEDLRTEIAEREKVEQRLIEYQRQLQLLASELSLAEERLRRRIAVDVHDRIGQNLAISRIKIESLVGSVSSPEYSKTLNEIRDLIAQTIASTRSLTFELSPPVLYELGFESAIEWLVRQTRQQHNLSAEFENDNRPKPLDDNIRVLLFQAVRELLVNVVKHASAKKVTVTVRRVNNEIRVEVADDGVGFDVSRLGSADHKTDGFGLFSIRERLSHTGGQLNIESSPGRGTQVTLAAPIGQKSKERPRITSYST